jgi:aminoglycoside/choline kinase family phosphotransferase
MSTRDEMIAFSGETLGLRGEASVKLSQLAGRGSDRTYYRVRWGTSNSVILVRYQPGRIENRYFADIARFLLNNGIPVPKIIRHDAANCLIIMQDLGHTDLCSLQHESWEIRKDLYQKTLAIALKLHSFEEDRLPSGGIRLMEPFGPDLYRWERNYFLDNFVHALCGIELEPNFKRQLEAELEALARRLASGRQSLVHRDLQSQNVIISGEAPFLIDFQGMRYGTRFYDLGSLLCDPYVVFSETERKELLSFYRELSKLPSEDGFQQMFWEASAQRLMQALGAYGYLGLHRGLSEYTVHIPAGLRNLQTAAEKSASLPKLFEVCARCGEALAGGKIVLEKLSDQNPNQDIQ